MLADSVPVTVLVLSSRGGDRQRAHKCPRMTSSNPNHLPKAPSIAVGGQGMNVGGTQTVSPRTHFLLLCFSGRAATVWGSPLRPEQGHRASDEPLRCRRGTGESPGGPCPHCSHCPSGCLLSEPGARAPRAAGGGPGHARSCSRSSQCRLERHGGPGCPSQPSGVTCCHPRGPGEDPQSEGRWGDRRSLWGRFEPIFTVCSGFLIFSLFVCVFYCGKTQEP